MPVESEFQERDTILKIPPIFAAAAYQNVKFLK